jgi:hypothetical protein
MSALIAKRDDVPFAGIADLWRSQANPAAGFRSGEAGPIFAGWRRAPEVGATALHGAGLPPLPGAWPGLGLATACGTGSPLSCSRSVALDAARGVDLCATRTDCLQPVERVAFSGLHGRS